MEVKTSLSWRRVAASQRQTETTVDHRSDVIWTTNTCLTAFAVFKVDPENFLLQQRFQVSRQISEGIHHHPHRSCPW